MNYTEEQFDKLPKWAKSEIKRLEVYTKTLSQRINEFSGKAETNTFLREGLGEMPLQNNANIEFRTGKNNMNKVSVYVRQDGNIDINAYSHLGQDMFIMPRASNSFYITFKDNK